jgi:alpha-ribazole phosphatase
MRVYLVRHPPPLIDPGICYGSSDLLCAPDRLAQTLADALPLLPSPPARVPVFASPLQRCADLARALPSVAPIFDARLVEMHFGAWEMQRWDAIARADVDAWAADRLDYRPGGGESLRQMTERLHAFYLMLLQRNDPETIVVCHAGPIRVLTACAPDRTIAQIAETAATAGRTPAYGEVVLWQPLSA